MHDLGVVNGRGDGRFAPADPVTRAEFAKLLATTLGLAFDPAMPNPFVDVPASHWAEPYIRILYAYGLITAMWWTGSVTSIRTRPSVGRRRPP